MKNKFIIGDLVKVLVKYTDANGKIDSIGVNKGRIVGIIIVKDKNTNEDYIKYKLDSNGQWYSEDKLIRTLF